jgi:hypothetical protein
MLRTKLLAASVVAATALSVAPAAQAAGEPALWFEYDFVETLEPAIGNGSATTISAPTYPTHDFGGGKVRHVLDIDAGNARQTAYLYSAGQQWTATAYLRVDSVSATKRLFRPSLFTDRDEGLYVSDGKLLWRPASGTPTETAQVAVAANTWFQLTLTRANDGKLVVYLNGQPRITVIDPGKTTELSPENAGSAAFFGDNTGGAHPNEHGAGQIARLRVYGQAKTAQEVLDGASDTIDVAPPEPMLSSPEPKPWAGGARVVAPNAEFRGWVSGGRAEDVTIEFRKNGQTVEAERPVYEDGLSGVSWTSFASQGTLSEGAGYSVRLRARDQVGNVGVKDVPITVDATKPTGLTLTGPDTQTSSTQPVLTGKVDLATGDEHVIGFRIWTGVEYHGNANLVSDGQKAFVNPDGTFSAPLKRTYGGGGAALKPGLYSVAVGHCDEPGNCQAAIRLFTVTDGSAPTPATPAATNATPSPAPVPPTARPASLQASPLQSAITSLKAAGRKALRSGRATVTFTSPLTGTAKIEVRAKNVVLASATSKVKQGAAAKLRLTPTKRGRTLLRAAKARTVLVRLTLTQPGTKPTRAEQALVLGR